MLGPRGDKAADQRRSIALRARQVAEWRYLPAALWVIAGLGLLRLTIRGMGAGYDLTVVDDAARTLVAGGNPYNDPMFLYLPSSLLFSAPFTLFEQQTVVALGAIAAAATLVWLCVASARLLGDRVPSWVAPAALIVIDVSRPGGALMDGVNSELLPLAALPVLYWLASRGQWDRYGLLLGVAIAIKPILAPLVFLILLARAWRAAVWAVASPVALSAAALLLIPGGFGVVPTILEHLSGPSQVISRSYDVSITGIFRDLGIEGPPVLLARAAVLLLGIVAAVVRWRTARTNRRAVEVGSLLMLVGILVAGLGWDHYLLFVVPLFIVAAGAGATMRERWPVWACLGFLCIGTVLRLPHPEEVSWHAYGFRAGTCILLAALTLSAACIAAGRSRMTADR